MAENITINNGLITDLRQIIVQGRRQAYISINASMIQTYWNVGRRIVEEEQHGKERAEYGTGMLKNIALELMPEFGDNFTDRRLRDYRQFYLSFSDLEIWHSCVPNLTWTHIRHLLRVDDAQARLWYMKETATALYANQGSVEVGD